MLMTAQESLLQTFEQSLFQKKMESLDNLLTIVSLPNNRIPSSDCFSSFNNTPTKPIKSCNNLGLSQQVIKQFYLNIYYLNIDNLTKLLEENQIIQKLQQSSKIFSLDSLHIEGMTKPINTHKEWSPDEFILFFSNESPMLSAIAGLLDHRGRKKQVKNLREVILLLQNECKCRLSKSKRINNIQLHHVKRAFSILDDTKYPGNLIFDDLDAGELKHEYLDCDVFITKILLQKNGLFKPFTHIFSNDTKITKKRINKLINYWSKNKFDKFINIDSNPWKLETDFDKWNANFKQQWNQFIDQHNETNGKKMGKYIKRVCDISQKIRNERIGAFTDGMECIQSPLYKFACHDIFEQKLVQYIFYFAGLNKPCTV